MRDVQKVKGVEWSEGEVMARACSRLVIEFVLGK